ncbi:Maf family protein [Stratiformator vulcanicus]|uniref:dTTP/UTP pyrophosphatase n=1 Tax=Stratiformator vulcanicus TaxID=2527980 RepID=A0A517R4E8_9PLAN|nr:Maf family protein [Stratiformator vulcanicus]QDT38746.1 Maf-like protein YhdE [Stratiformator vulcanicus]
MSAEEEPSDGGRPGQIVLASSSPRRRELLELIVDASRIEVVPPPDAREQSLDHLRSVPEIVQGVCSIASQKARSVGEILGSRNDVAAIVAADTTVIVDDRDQARSLGKPDGSCWRDQVSEWFRRYYSGQTHSVVTGVCVIAAGRQFDFSVTTAVTMVDDLDRHLEWYLATEEPLGKAGGYAIQGAGATLVKRVDGSLTNVVGLPLRELNDLFGELGIDVG